MRNFPAEYAAIHDQPAKCPTWVAVITYRDSSIYDFAIPSHRDLDLGLNYTTRALINKDGLSGSTQRIEVDGGNSSIGSQFLSIVDIDSTFSLALKQKRDSGQDIRHAVVSVYQGYQGLAFSDYVRLWTQKVEDHSFESGVYRLNLSDVLHDLNQDIMTPKTGRALEVSSAGSPRNFYFPFGDPNDFEIFHDSDYRVDPGQSITYWRVTSTDEIVSGRTFSYQNNSIFGLDVWRITQITRAKFNTIREDLDPTKIVDFESSYEVEEVAYLEGHPADLILQLWTGQNIAGGGQVPEHWHAGLDRNEVDLSSFEALKNQSPSLRMMVSPGEKNALKWVHKHIMQPLQWQCIVGEDGRLELKQTGRTGPDTPHDIILTEADFLSPPKVTTQTSHLCNVFEVKWNYSIVKDDFLDSHTLISEWSRSRYGESATKTFELESLIPGNDAYQLIASLFSNLQKNWAQPRTIISGQIKNRHDLEVTDVAKVVIEGVDGCSAVSRDYRTGEGDTVNRSFEAHQANYRPLQNTVDVLLFGAGSDTDITDFTYGDVSVPDSAILAIGSDWPYTTNVTGNLSVAPGVYHIDGDFRVRSGATLTLSSPGTLVLAVTGEITIDGEIDFSGQGARAGQAGGIGKTSATGGVNIRRLYQATGNGDACTLSRQTWQSTQPEIITGETQTLSGWTPIYDGTSLSGFPTNLTGTGGGKGGDVVSIDDTSDCFDPSITPVNRTGQNGANGGGGLVTISSSISVSAAARVVLSGEDASSNSQNFGNVYTGSGGGGDSGAWLHVATTSLPVPSLINSVEAFRGGTDDEGSPLNNASQVSVPRVASHSFYSGYPAQDLSSERVRIAYASDQ